MDDLLNDEPRNKPLESPPDRYFSEWLYDYSQRDLKSSEKFKDISLILMVFIFYFVYHFILSYFHLQLSKFVYNFYLWLFILLMATYNFLHAYKLLSKFKIRQNEYELLKVTLSSDYRNIYGKSVKGETIKLFLVLCVVVQLVGLLFVLINPDFGAIGEIENKKFVLICLALVGTIPQELLLFKILILKFKQGE